MTTAGDGSSATGPAGEGGALVRIVGADLGYGEAPVLHGVSLSVNPGEFLGVVGPNGSGKTTLLRALLGVLPLRTGRREARARLGYAPQRSALDPIYPFLAREVVAMGLLGPEARGLPPGEARARVERALADCGIEDLTQRPVRDLSGGQKQRVIVARALVSDPDVLVLDEPTNDLDVRAEHEVMELLRALHAKGKAIVMVTHLLYLVATHAERLAFIHRGRLEVGPAEEMLEPERLARLFGAPMIVEEVGGHRLVAPARAPQEGP